MCLNVPAYLPAPYAQLTGRAQSHTLPHVQLSLRERSVHGANREARRSADRRVSVPFNPSVSPAHPHVCAGSCEDLCAGLHAGNGLGSMSRFPWGLFLSKAGASRH